MQGLVERFACSLLVLSWPKQPKQPVAPSSSTRVGGEVRQECEALWLCGDGSNLATLWIAEVDLAEDVESMHRRGEFTGTYRSRAELPGDHQRTRVVGRRSAGLDASTLSTLGSVSNPGEYPGSLLVMFFPPI